MKRKRNGRIDNKSITPSEREIIRAFLQERLDDFRKARETSRTMCKIDPGSTMRIKLDVYNSNAVSAMMHVMAILQGGEDGPAVSMADNGVGERSEQDVCARRTTHPEEEGEDSE